MDAYSNGHGPCTAEATASISGRSLTHRHKSEAERIEAAVAILDGELGVHDPCVLQVSRLCNVSAAKVRAARQRRNGNGHVENNGHTETLAQHMERGEATS
jgi:hypothetical protein